MSVRRATAPETAAAAGTPTPTGGSGIQLAIATVPPLGWIATPTGARMLAQLTLAINANSIAAMDGAPGLGKTSLAHELHRRVQASGRLATNVHLPEKASEKDIYTLVTTAINGHCREAPARVLREQLVSALSGSNRVLLLDEAHRVGTGGLQLLRHLWDRGNRSWAMILIGQTVRQALSGAAELQDRVPLVLDFQPMGGVDVLAAVHQFGPLFEPADDETIRRVDRAYCHGRWRPWNDVRERAIALAPGQGETMFSERLARNVLGTWGRTL